VSAQKYFVKLDEADNVVTVTKETPAKTIVRIDSEDITVLQDIPFGHKFAITNIAKGEDIIKYGVKIGIASTDIGKGEYVHVHNVADVSLEIREEAKRKSLGGI
jgi:altronate dehydratase